MSPGVRQQTPQVSSLTVNFGVAISVLLRQMFPEDRDFEFVKAALGLCLSGCLHLIDSGLIKRKTSKEAAVSRT